MHAVGFFRSLLEFSATFQCNRLHSFQGAIFMKIFLIVICLVMGGLAGAAFASETISFDSEAVVSDQGRAVNGPSAMKVLMDPRHRRMRAASRASKNRAGSPIVRANEAASGGTWTSMPSDTGYDLEGVWGSSDTADVFAVGAAGTIVHYDGTSWTEMSQSATNNYLYGVWGSSSSNVFAVGEQGTILRYNGYSWARMSSPATDEALLSVWGSSPSNVFAVGTDGTILHFNGTSWSVVRSDPGYTIEDVWGNTDIDAYAVQWKYPSYDAALLKYNGSVWSSIVSGTSVVYGLWTGSPNDVFIVGEKGRISRYMDGSLIVMSYGEDYDLEDVWGSSSSDVFAVGGVYPSGTIVHYDGMSWTPMASGTGSYYLTGVWGRSPTDVFAVGLYGTILHYTYVEPTTLYVSNSGCGTKTPCYTTIQQAVNAAANVAVINIAEGTYSGDFTLSESKSLTLRGGWDSSFTFQNKKTSLIKAPKAPQGSLTLQQLTIKP